MDGLRGIAALLVVWLHIAEIHIGFFPEVAAHGTGWLQALQSVDAGRLGVVTFFLVSGYVIPSSLRGPRRAGLRKFAIRRLFRLWPAYIPAVLAGYLCVRLPWYPPMPPGSLWANFTMIQEALGFPSVMGHFWTLQTELVFYALCASAFALGWLHTLTYLVVTVLLGASRSLTSLPFHLALMNWGALLRRWHDAGRKRDRWLLALVATGLWIVRAPLGYLHLSDPQDIINGRAYGLGFLLFVAGCTVLPLGWRPLAWLGEISYSLYLYHPALFYLGIRLSIIATVPAAFRSQPIVVYEVFYTALSIAVAAAVYRWIEKPAIDTAHRLTRTPMPQPTEKEFAASTADT